jgi:uncharacterized protein YjbJ (UPF0337 family)
MAGTDKARNKTQKVKGKAKEVIGRAINDPGLETQGREDQRTADLKDAGEKIKDALRPKGRRQQR